MDGCPCANIFSVDFCCKDFINSFKSESSYMVPKERYYHCTDLSSATEENYIDELGFYEIESAKIKGLHDAFERTLQIKDDRLPGHNLSSDHNEIVQANDNHICNELESRQMDTLNNNMKKSLKKHVTFPFSKENMLSTMPMQSQSCLNVQNPGLSEHKTATTHAQSSSFPSALRLVSAMKGGREQRGQPSKLKLNVKWAPDVYDPPMTLMSHTVKNHQRRPKPKKKDSSNKHKQKGKSSRSTATGKKRINRSICSTTGSLYLSMQAPAGKLLLDGFAQSGMEEIHYAIDNKESNSGSRFLMGSLAKVQFPVAEAS